MKQKLTTTTHVCGCCKQELPVESFYFIKKSQQLDSYCKKCRKATSSNQRNKTNSLYFANRKRKHPVITDIKDRELRITLIIQAQQVVNESIERKRKKSLEDESADD